MPQPTYEEMLIAPCNTYEFTYQGGILQVEWGLGEGSDYILSIPLNLTESVPKEGIRTLLSLLPMNGPFAGTFFVLDTAIQIAEMRGWTVKRITMDLVDAK
ncbi:MAG: hypothetical protein K9J17_09620 [Flavobacteriales bacterium]|nr:hypothetical protein [Flavobacteriales bacterium]